MPERHAKPRGFESALAEFESLVEKMERGDLSLEDSVSAYERGVVLHRYCEDALSAAERKIRILTEGSEEASADETLQAFESGSEARVDGATDSPAPAPEPRRTAARETKTDDLPF